MTARQPDQAPTSRTPGHVPAAGTGASPVTSGLAHFLDDLVRIPGTRYRVGLDPVIGFVPVVGDAVGTIVAAAVLAEAIRNRVPVHILFRMGWNYLVDAVLGVIPFVGDVADIAHKATSKNLRLVDRTIAEGKRVDTDARGYLARAVGAVGLMLLILIGMAGLALWGLLKVIGLF
ncbi:DUF4112 domain-containing protein [Rhodococcus sp. IEGM 1408]|uniref:DUF4112 domain-containing protein n=1 Tax=Rhodococcus sp. IEGM 1408 TaxID=3082220 RepID=UPI002953DF17|nr:DUF4112 domain-containing protein [Rhodococcus sp. IEGM 1408]MDV7999783.1 DUF4112 domain-containing protein [Rhodococcus sp. IEGM 1408]